jgi:hypothetical protein
MMGGFCFKPTEGGYVFRTPNPWGMMPAKHYFVSEAQRAQIKDILNLPAQLLAVVWLVSIALFIGGPFLFGFFYYGYEGPENPSILMLLAFVVSVIVGVWLPLPLIRFWQLHRLEPVLHVARPTTERISRKERLEGRSVSDYVWNCIGYSLAFGFCTFIAGQKFETVGTSKGSYSDFVLCCVVAIVVALVMVNSGRRAIRVANKFEPRQF